MKIKTNQFIEKLIWVLTVAWFSSSILFERETMGRYMLLGIAVVIFLLYTYKNKGRVRLAITPWHCFIAMFAVFCYLSSLWALNAGDAIQKGTTITLILLCFSMVYMHYLQENTVKQMISAIKWAGYVVSIYAILFYGFDNLITMLNNEDRINSVFSNVNTIGMLCALAVVIEVYELSRNEKLTISLLFSLPSIIIIAATQSRKALLFAAAGIVLVFITKSIKDEKNITGFFRVLCALAVSILGIIVILQLPMFAGVLDRINMMLAAVTGEGTVDSSTALRTNMTRLGWEQFLQHPIGGVGIGCPYILSAQYLHKNTYLHNNFAELLAGGGIIGFFLYYGMYIYIITNLIKYRNYAETEYWLCMIMVILLLIMDYGMVSYYSKETYFYFMMLFLEVKILRKRSNDSATNSVVEKRNAVSAG